MKDVIDSFRGQYHFLSNFYREKDGLTVEHRFQAEKNEDPKGRDPFPAKMTPGQAKAAGRRLHLRGDWETVKNAIMESLIREKFKDRILAAELLSTGDSVLVEGNDWRDKTWGMVKGSDGKWKGENRLGKVLMKIRDELRGMKP